MNPSTRRRTRWRRASFTCSGGTAPYTYAITAGSLPLGLSLSSSGVISGTPVNAQTKTFTIQSTDSDGSSATRNYSLTTFGGSALMFASPMLLAGDTLKYSFTHDANGRMLTKGNQQAYVYDALNRMTQVTGKETYLYDGHGRRVQITKSSDTLKNYPMYSLDGKLLLEDNRQTLKRTEYIYAGGRLVAKRIQPITSTGANTGVVTTTYIHTDFLGSPVAETSATGTVTRVERYTPYGEPSDLQLDVGPGFTGHATDVLTGLTYMQQRYYDAEIGRFISPDPVGPEEDFIKHFNRYNYAQNNPVRYTDPDGRSALTLAIKFIAKGGDAAATFAGVIDDANTVMDSNASFGDRAMAVGSILSEAAPVSLRDGKAVVKAVEKVASKANTVADAARSGKREIKISDGYKTRTDSSTKGEGGSHTHVYDPKGKEVARVNGNGGYSESHGGKPLLPPSALPKDVRNDVNRIITNRPEKKP